MFVPQLKNSPAAEGAHKCFLLVSPKPSSAYAAGLHSRTKPRGQDEKGAMAGTIVEPSKTNHGEITLDLSAAAGPAVEERQGDDQEDSRTGRRTEEGEGWGRGRVGMGTSPAGALAHLPCCHTKGDTIRVGLKDGFFFPPPGSVGCPGRGV